MVGERPGFRTIDAAKVALADALDDRLCLLVIDDAWRVQDLAPFLHRGPRNQTTRLVTTRHDRVLPDDAARIPVDAMTSDEALAMLSHGLPTPMLAELRNRLFTLAARLGEWPLLLGLAGRVVRSRIARGASPVDALTYVHRRIEQRGIAIAFQRDDRESRRRTAWGTLEISLEQLRNDERTRFTELRRFEGHEHVVSSVTMLADGRRALSGSADRTMRLWNLETGAELTRPPSMQYRTR